MERNLNSIEARQLSIGYATQTTTSVIAESLNFSLPKGQLISLLGENGSGKSTLLRTLTFVQPKLSGEILIGGTHLETLSASEIAKNMALVLTENLPESNLSVFELVALGRQPYTDWLGRLTDADVSAVGNALEATGMSHLSDRRYYQLSSGQLQHVLIARALAQETPILILDEPANHLDYARKAALYDLLSRLAKDFGKSILISTHDLEMAMEFSDAFLLMHDGKIESGTSQELIENGGFSRIFSNGLVRFDPMQKKFFYDRRP